MPLGAMTGKGGGLAWAEEGVKVNGEDEGLPASESRGGTGAKGTTPFLEHEGRVGFEVMEAASSSGRKNAWTCACSAAGARGTTAAGPWLRCAMGESG